MRTGMTHQDEDGAWWVVVATEGEEGIAHWAGPFETRELAIDECHVFGMIVEAPEAPEAPAN